MDIFIYGLYNSFDSEIRYIGKTNNVKRRITDHIIEAKSGNYSHFPKNRWILKTIAENGKVLAKVLEITDEENWKEREQYWIKYFRSLPGKENLNLSDGGDGFVAHDFLSYEECKKWVKENIPTIKSETKWKKEVAKSTFPDCIPRHPELVYDNFSWFDFFEKPRKEKLLDVFSIDEVKKIIRRNKLVNIQEVREFFCKDFLFPKPQTFNKVGFDLKRFLDEMWYVDYDVLKRYILMFFPEIKSLNDFQKEHKKMNKRIPYYLKEKYGEVFDDFAFLKYRRRGSDTYHVFRDFYSYEEAKVKVKPFDFKNSVDFRKRVIGFKELDPMIPHSPEIVYKDKGWAGWEDFLGYTSNKRRKDCTLETFIRYMRLYHPEVHNSTSYKKMFDTKTISKNIPKRPDIKYHLEWKKLFNMIKL